ncbi:MAG TPA: hypothetical protein VKS21_01775, partial [Spirochaetota bacterium]|nr:hypothetical protein [Spirochaetota bacterium]
MRIRVIKTVICLMLFCSMLPSAGTDMYTPFVYRLTPAKPLITGYNQLAFANRLFLDNTAVRKYNFFAGAKLKKRFAGAIGISGLHASDLGFAEFSIQSSFFIKFKNILQNRLENITGISIVYEPINLGSHTAAGWAFNWEYFVRFNRTLSLGLHARKLPAFRIWKGTPEYLQPEISIINTYHFHPSNVFGLKLELPDLFISCGIRQRLWKALYLNGSFFMQDGNPGGSAGLGIKIRN